jgi:hypothetical protein
MAPSIAALNFVVVGHLSSKYHELQQQASAARCHKGEMQMGKQLPYGYIDELSDVSEDDVRSLIGRRITYVTGLEYTLGLQLDDGQELSANGWRWEGCNLGVTLVKAPQQIIEYDVETSAPPNALLKLIPLLEHYTSTLIRRLNAKAHLIRYKTHPDLEGILMARIAHGNDQDCHVWMRDPMTPEESWVFVPRFLAPLHFFKQED